MRPSPLWTKRYGSLAACSRAVLEPCYLCGLSCLVGVRPPLAHARHALALILMCCFRPQIQLVGSKIPPAIPKPAVGPGIYALFTFVLPMAPAVGPFSPLILSVIMTAFGGRNIIAVTRSNAAPAAAASAAPAKKEPAKGDKSDSDTKKAE